MMALPSLSQRGGIHFQDCRERPRSKDCNGESRRSGMAPPECSDCAAR